MTVWSTISKALLGVLTGIIAYLTPMIKKYLSQVLEEYQTKGLDKAVSTAIKSNLFLLDWFWRDKQISEDERQQFIMSVKTDVTKALGIGKVNALKKVIDFDSYVTQQCNAAMLDFTVERQLKQTGGDKE